MTKCQIFATSGHTEKHHQWILLHWQLNKQNLFILNIKIIKNIKILEKLKLFFITPFTYKWSIKQTAVLNESSQIVGKRREKKMRSDFTFCPKTNKQQKVLFAREGKKCCENPFPWQNLYPFFRISKQIVLSLFKSERLLWWLSNLQRMK